MDAEQRLVPNAASPLAELLGRLGWSGRRLVREINAWLARHDQRHLQIHQTSAYHWLKRGLVPRPPIPSIVAAVLSQELGELITVEQLWPGRGLVDRSTSPSADGLGDLRSTEDAVRSLLELNGLANEDRRLMASAPGHQLHRAALETFRATPAWTPSRAGRTAVLAPQVDAIASHLEVLRRLDDRHGGGSLNLGYLTAQLRAVLMLAQVSQSEPALARRLFVLIADLAQLTGWMHFDAGMYGPAQRYLLLGARIARSIGDPGRAANTIGMLAYAASFDGHGTEALRIADLALQHMPAGDARLEARLRGREATAAAAAGDLSRFRSASERACALLDSCHRTETLSSSYLYYFTGDQLAAEMGQSLVVLAHQQPGGERRLLDEAITRLAPLSANGREDYPRSSLLHSTFLAEAYLRRGAADESVAVASRTIELLPDVQSSRGRQRLTHLRSAYARRRRSRPVDDFLPELDRALLA
jgi:hypothetical protein